MPEFKYRARTQANQVVEGVVEEKNWDEARKWLRSRYKALISLQEVKRARIVLPRLPVKVNQFSLAVFFRQLETMLAAGIPSHRALYSLGTVGDQPRLEKAIMQMYSRIEGGSSLSAAMGEHPQMFSPLQMSLVRTGEGAGKLERCLSKIAEQAERENHLRQKFVSTLTYPIMLGFVCLALIGLFTMYLVPKMQAIFVTVGGKPPFITRLLLGFVDLATRPSVWVTCALLLVALMIGFPLLYRRPPVRRAVDAFLLEIPFLGPLLRKTASSQMLMAWALLLESGVPIGPQMKIVGKVAGNVIVREAFDRAQEEMSEGEEIHAALAHSQVFPNMVVQMVKVGEESGELDYMMRKVAEMYEEEVSTALTDLAGILEPMVLAVMGCIVGFVAVATALPVINLSAQL